MLRKVRLNQWCGLAFFLIGFLLVGAEVPKPTSLEVLRNKAEAGNVEAAAELGDFYADGEGGATNSAEAIKWWQKAADQGDARSQFNLAWWMEEGSKIPKDLVGGAKWYRKLAESGMVYAQVKLGYFYLHGRGVGKDVATAIQWYRKAALQADIDAQVALGYIYFKGEGVPKDAVEAAKWYRMAAELGSKIGEFHLGYMYHDGIGVPKDFEQALFWLRKAAQKGIAEAQYDLGVMFQEGQGVERNLNEAAIWFAKAANQGLADAQRNLASQFASGEGVPKDKVVAYKWANLAAAQQAEASVELRDHLETEMTRGQIAEGQRLTREFVPKKESEDKNNESLALSEPIASGTGFFITADGWLVTNAHVVEGGLMVKVVTASGMHPGKIVCQDTSNDLALIKVEGTFDALPVGPSRAVKLGQTVATVGFPNTSMQGFSPKLAKGEISSIAGVNDDPRQFQISVPVQPGNSGGPLVDTSGNVVGIVVGKLNAGAALAVTGALPENVNYAIKSGFLLSFLEAAPKAYAGLKEVSKATQPFESVIARVERSVALILVFR
jgi:TPR repeat protein